MCFFYTQLHTVTIISCSDGVSLGVYSEFCCDYGGGGGYRPSW